MGFLFQPITGTRANRTAPGTAAAKVCARADNDRNFAAAYWAIACLAVVCLLVLSACSTKKKEVAQTATPILPAPPLPTAATATMMVAAGANVVGHVVLPPGFTPVAPYAPLWLRNGSVLAAVGAMGDKTAIIGFATTGARAPFVIATDFGPVVPGGKITDVVASPDGMTLAIAAIEPTSGRLDIILHEVIAPDESNLIASFNGVFDSVSLAWLDPQRIAVGLRSNSNSTPPAQPDIGAPANVENASPSGLFVIDTTGLGSVNRIPIDCPLSRLSWSPNGNWAIGTGDTVAAPVLIRLRPVPACVTMHGGPIDPIGWSPDSASILYSAPSHGSRGVFRHDPVDGSTSPIAISSASAAWTSTGQILALGSQALTWRAAQAANKPWPVQLAMMGPAMPDVEILSLGIRTTAPMLALSTMAYAQATDMAAIDLITPGSTGPIRRIIVYLQPTRTALTIASGPVIGPVLMSWSPDGNNLAMLDSNLGASVITVVSPIGELRAHPSALPFSVVGGKSTPPKRKH
jgi:hypothetical protein